MKLARSLITITLTLSTGAVCFADEAPSEQEVICMGLEDRAPCRYEDYDGVLRSGNCADQICVPHCPASAEEGSECTFIIGSGEERPGTCEEGVCNITEPTGGMESSGGEAAGGEDTGGQSLSDFLDGTNNDAGEGAGESANESAGDDVMPPEEREATDEDDSPSDAEESGCEQSSAALTAPLMLCCLMLLGLFRRRHQETI